MDKRVINLEIIEDLQESGVNAISLVDIPAINKNFLHLSEEKFVEPRSGESEDEFIGRCIPVIMDEGKPQEQAIAMCYSMWEQNMSVDTTSLPPYSEQGGTGPISKLAAVEDLKVGDAVSWKTADQNPRGRITEIVRDGSKKVPGADFEVTGTEEDPGYIIRQYEEGPNGNWIPTETYVGRKAGSLLKNVELRVQMFVSEDQKILVGPALIPDLEIFRRGRDKGEDYYVQFTKEAVAKAAEKFMKDLNGNNTNVQHTQGLPAGTYVFESWLVEDPETDKANTVYNQDVPEGTWMIKARVENESVWKLVKDGKVNGFSIEGNFLTEEEYQEYLKDKKTYEDLRALIETFKD